MPAPPDDPVDDLYRRLQRDAAKSRGIHAQVCHRADIEGHHLYMADTSFGYGPIFRFDDHAWMCEDDRGWQPIYRHTTQSDLRLALAFAERAAWAYRLEELDLL